VLYQCKPHQAGRPSAEAQGSDESITSGIMSLEALSHAARG